MIVHLEQKRKHPRMQCSGVALIYPLDAGAGLSSRVVDLSQKGCLLVLDEPLNLEVEAVAEIFFTVHQLSFRVRARVAAIRSSKLYGFEFLATNRSGRLQVAELIEELAAEKMKQLEGSRARSGSEAIELREPAPVRREKGSKL
jgi:hypothetical protein